MARTEGSLVKGCHTLWGDPFFRADRWCSLVPRSTTGYEKEVGRAGFTAPPPSEPDWRISRIRLSGW